MPVQAVARVRLIAGSVPAGLRGAFALCLVSVGLIPVVDVLVTYWMYVLVMTLQGRPAPIPEFIPVGGDTAAVILLFVLLMMMRQGLEFWAIHRTRHFTQRCYRIFSVQLFQHYMSLAWLTYAGETKATRLKHLTSTALNAAYMYQVVFDFAGSLLLLLLLGAVAAAAAPLPFAGVVLALAVFMGLSHKYVGSRVGAATRMHEIRERQVYNRLQENLHMFREIRMFGVLPFVMDLVRRDISGLSKVKTDLSIYTHVPRLALEMMFTAALGAGIGIAMLQDEGSAAPLLAGLASLTIMARRIIPAMSLFLSSSTELEGGKEVMHSLMREYAAAVQPQLYLRCGDLPPGRLLEVRGADFAYRPDRPVLRRFSLHADRGERIAVTGETGTGKSTLLMIAAGYIRPSSGSAVLSAGLSPAAGDVAYVPQETALLSGTIRDNVVFGHGAADEALLWEVLGQVRLADTIRQLPLGLDADAGDNGAFFSGGQRQRIGIARALYRQPKLLFLDEATSSLDEETEREVMDNVNRWIGAEGAVLFITHRKTACERHATRMVAIPSLQGGRSYG